MALKMKACRTFAELVVLAGLVLCTCANAEELTSHVRTRSLALGRRRVSARRVFGLPVLRPWAPKVHAHGAGVGNRSSKASSALSSSDASGRLSSMIARKDAALPEQDMLGDLVTLGEYYLALNVGGQLVNVQIDTGSSTLAVPLKACVNCLPEDHRLDLMKNPTRSSFVKCDSKVCRPNSCQLYGQCSACSRLTRACCSTIDPDKCGFFLSYADGSGASGALVQADVTMANITVPAYFGAILRVKEGFENDVVDGILGMAFKSLACNPTCVLPLFDVMVLMKKVSHDIFALCTGRNGGVLTLGGSNPDLYTGKLKYVPLVGRSEMHFYDVSIHTVRVGGASVPVPDFSNGIVDSGTTVLVVAPRAYAAFKKYFQRKFCHVPGLCPGWAQGPQSGKEQVKIIRASAARAASFWASHEANVGGNVFSSHRVDGDTIRPEEATWFSPGYCAALSDEDVSQLPTITILLSNGVELSIEPALYMLRYEVQSRFSWDPQVFRCLGMTYLPGLDQMENNVILGDVVMQKYYVEFDRENMRVGFAESRNCVHGSDKAAAWNADMSSGFASARKHFLSPRFVAALFVASCLAWVFVIYLWTQQAKRNAYVPIR